MTLDQIVDRVINIRKRYGMEQQKIKILCYAADIVIIADNEDDSKRMLFKFNQVTVTKEYNM